ncbi:hypothetical protein [Citrobacter amalonaticus]|uniref:hypothetical protein n=1 Tax=Citrobacter amalonaticus TaxID=35703 RepID=UPI00255AA737|nr:hypothetical protein [Citrobacter amalonaticus]MDL4619974.1 hypothetical protein [Citrobacter amalonaticus]MDL4624072.1 hypothetical protein [Citrobacter amalonaticus]
MRLKSVNAIAFIMGIFTSPLAISSMSVENVYWQGGDHAGELAANCVATYPFLTPMTIPRTLVADSSFEIGDVIYSWDYADFMPDYIRVRCTPSGIDSNVTTNTMDGSYVNVNINTGGSAVNGILPTGLDGVGIRLFYRVDSTTDGINGWLSIQDNGNGSIDTNSPIDERRFFNTNSAGNYLLFRCRPANHTGARYIYGCDYSLSFRAELVKTGPITVGSLDLAAIDDYLLVKWPDSGNDGQSSQTSFSTGNAITLIAPACQLKNANYAVSMGDMVPLSATPRRGPNVPVNLDLECSGQVNNVNFRFEDAGMSPSSGLEKNVSLYSSEGTPVGGLEIEMRYEGERVNIDGNSEISTGIHGQRKTVADALPLFDSESTANFTANYVQIGPVISGGTGFTGAINGKVNMWVTYN